MTDVRSAGDTAAPVESAGSGRPLLLTALAGAAAGTAYGAALRGWMRLISTDPEFTWGGTGYVVAVFTVLGTSAGLVVGLRRTGGVRALLLVRVVGIVLSLGCFVAAGSAMLPTVVPGALGRARTDWPHPVRLALVALAAATAVVISVSSTLAGLAPARLAAGLVLYPVLCAVEIEITARLYAPSLPAGSLGTPVRVTAAVVGVALPVGVVLLMRGLPGSG